MAYGDRFTVTDKDFGRRVVIKIKRGKPTWDQDRRELTIVYKDSKVGGLRKSKPKK